MKEFHLRLRLLSIGILVIALILITKLYFIQIVSGDTFRERAEHQYVAGANYFDRGSIFFTTKDGVLVPAATVESGFLLSINPRILQTNSTAQEAYSKLSVITPIDHDDFFARAGKKDDPYEVVAEHLSEDTAEKIQDLGIPGISVFRQRWRVYPGKEMAAHTIGFMGYKGNVLSGRYGLERYYDSTLDREGDSAFVNFFVEMFSNIKKSVSKENSLEGDIVTTLEPSVQAFLEQQLEKIEEQYHSEFSGGIIIDPKTGEIRAMAQWPPFDPNAPEEQESSAVFRDKLVEDRYEMGSIIKALTIASGLDSGVITANTTFNDPGCMTLNTKTFCNYDGESHGSAVTMQEVLSYSLNTGAAFVVSKMGNKKFADYMKNFALGELTDIDLPNEGKSLISNLSTGRDLELAEASFGQGIALTPIITTRALSSLANGGYLIKPHLVKEIKYDLGTSKTIEYPKGKQVIKPETSEEISRMLTASVDYVLREGSMRLDRYSIGAKTGTAQIAKEGGGGYYQNRYLHSFFGYFPSYDPKFLIFLYTYYPKDVQYASETLTDAFFNTAKFLISYYEIPPDREGPPPSPFN